MKKQNLLLAVLFSLGALVHAEPRGWLGIYHRELPPEMLVALNLPHGVIVREVVSASPAEKAGLKLGDVIVRLDSQEIMTSEDLADYVGGRPGQSVRIVYARQCRLDSVNVPLGTRDRQLELAVDIPEGARQLIPHSLRHLPPSTGRLSDYLEELRELRLQLRELLREIGRLRKELRKSKEK